MQGGSAYWTGTQSIVPSIWGLGSCLVSPTIFIKDTLSTGENKISPVLFRWCRFPARTGWGTRPGRKRPSSLFCTEKKNWRFWSVTEKQAWAEPGNWFWQNWICRNFLKQQIWQKAFAESAKFHQNEIGEICACFGKIRFHFWQNWALFSPYFGRKNSSFWFTPALFCEILLIEHISLKGVETAKFVWVFSPVQKHLFSQKLFAEKWLLQKFQCKHWRATETKNFQ